MPDIEWRRNQYSMYTLPSAHNGVYVFMCLLYTYLVYKIQIQRIWYIVKVIVNLANANKITAMITVTVEMRKKTKEFSHEIL